jgi:uncharacterized repeat protein (TIGR03803 family)
MTNLTAWKMAGAVLMLWAATTMAAQAQTFNNLFNFDGTTNGDDPYLMSLVQGADGSLYGTTSAGGPHDAGTVFKIASGGALTTLYSFCAQTNCADGSNPQGSLVLATDGNFYGTTTAGGNGSCQVGCGTIFKLTARGKLTILHSFDGPDGYWPYGALVQATDGNFYGTTSSGGPHGWGTAFKITQAGVLTTLYGFCALHDCVDGASPDAGLIEANDGNFYGTTYVGGVEDCDQGCGTVFRITSAGVLTTLHSFDENDGAYPYGSELLQASDGSFYGTTTFGPTTDGTVFKITPGNRFTTVHVFDLTDGGTPKAGLIQGTDGNLYGTTTKGGAHAYGTVFTITSGGKLNTLHSFDSTDGNSPGGALVQATDGSFYGTTSIGGTDNYGTVFSLDMGLGPFVTLVRGAAKVGQAFGILGQGFAGTTSVLLNGTPASFTVVSDTFMKATVPGGATTGYVTVATPSGTLTSNVKFRVIR